MAADGSAKAIFAAFFANLGIAIAKLIGSFLTMSGALLAESIHSFADSGNQLLLLLGGRLSRRPPSPKHPFGYGKERYFWSFVVAMVLFSLGGAFAIYEGIKKIRDPHELNSVWWAIGILLFGIVLEGFSFRTAIVESNKNRAGKSWVSFIRRSKSPELPVILLEDLGALLGLVIALAAIVTASVTKNYIWDGIGSLTIGILLALIAIVLSIEMKSLLLGEGASQKNRAEVLEVFAETKGLSRVLELRTLHIGPEKLLITARVVFDESLDSKAVANLIDETSARLNSKLSIPLEIYIQPE